MNEKIIKPLSAIDSISDKLDSIKEEFVLFYGEKFRKEITERIENTLFIFVNPYESEEECAEFIDMVKVKFAKYQFLSENSIYKNIKSFKENTFKNGKNTLAEGVCLATISRLKLNKCYSIILLPTKDRLCDQVLFHELNHAVTTSSKLLKDTFEINVGFSSQRGKAAEYNKENWYNVVPFTEVITDYFACAIYENAKKNGIKIGEKGDENISYKSVFPMLEPFLEENYELIKNCFIENNRQGIINAVGKDNYNKLVLLTYYMLDFCQENGTTYNFYKSICEEEGEDIDIFEFAYDYKGDSTITKNYLNIFKQARKIYDDILDYKIENSKYDDGKDLV